MLIDTVIEDETRLSRSNVFTLVLKTPGLSFHETDSGRYDLILTVLCKIFMEIVQKVYFSCIEIGIFEEV